MANNPIVTDYGYHAGPAEIWKSQHTIMDRREFHVAL